MAGGRYATDTLRLTMKSQSANIASASNDHCASRADNIDVYGAVMALTDATAHAGDYERQLVAHHFDADLPET